ncbi:MAG: hypothetical protein ABI867_40790 [Kofleriaceae bacterium]
MRCHAVVLAVLLAGCAADATDEVDHDPTDFEVEPADGKGDGVAAVFDRHNVLTDALFTDGNAMTVEQVQAFLEASPYGNRSWLASHQIDGVSAAQAIVDAAQDSGIHPLVLVARMQVETSLVSKTTTPTQRLQDRALGCGCPDGGTCSSMFKGIARQLRCGATTMRRWYDASIAGSGEWREGTTRRTLDNKSVTPQNDATASLYAYTPWVLVGSGGTWLAWNVTRKYVRYAEAAGLLTPTP